MFAGSTGKLFQIVTLFVHVKKKKYKVYFESLVES